MATGSGVFWVFKEKLMDKGVDMNSDTFAPILMHGWDFTTNSGGGANLGQNYLDLTDGEVAGTGYTAGGVIALASPSITTAHATKWDANDISWGSASFTADGCIILDLSVAGSIPVCWVNFAGTKEVSSGTFTIQWNAAGIMTLT